MVTQENHCEARGWRRA